MEYKSDLEKETAYLVYTLALVERSLASIIRVRDAKVKMLQDLLSRYSSATPEYYNDIPITEALVRLYTKMIRGYEAASHKPYFGRILFDSEGELCNFYIGKVGVTDFDNMGDMDAKTLTVIDWRAPVSDLYYSASYGKTSYEAPGGRIEADVHLKTAFEIDCGKIAGLYDSDVMANDELLIKYLSGKKDAVLTDIVATIQQEQNDIIRLSPYTNVVVQGVAGSGKTTVAIHRVSYLLYNHDQFLNMDNVYVIASGKLFLHYMTSMLPDLDVPEIRQGTLFDFLSDYIREYDPGFLPAGRPDESPPAAGSVAGDIERINSYFEEYERSFYEKEGDLLLFDIEVASKGFLLDYIQIHRGQGMLDRAQQLDKVIQEKLYALKQVIVAYILAHKEDPQVRTLCVKVMGMDGTAILEEDVHKRFPRLAAKYKHRYFSKLKKLNYRKAFEKLWPEAGQGFRVRDLSALALIVRNLRLTESARSIRHIVIDEAQDFDAFVYCCLERSFTKANFSLVGDVMQVISGSGLQSWEEVLRFAFHDEADFRTLTKSYRNTIEISTFAQSMMSAYGGAPFYIEPVIRHGREVCIHQPGDTERQITAILEAVKADGYHICAVICANDKTARRLHGSIGAACSLTLLDQSLDALERGDYILSLDDAKGLEFDLVILPDFDAYNLKGADLKRAYVAVTRALHELHVFTANPLDKATLIV